MAKPKIDLWDCDETEATFNDAQLEEQPQRTIRQIVEDFLDREKEHLTGERGTQLRQILRHFLSTNEPDSSGKTEAPEDKPKPGSNKRIPAPPPLRKKIPAAPPLKKGIPVAPPLKSKGVPRPPPLKSKKIPAAPGLKSTRSKRLSFPFFWAFHDLLNQRK